MFVLIMFGIIFALMFIMRVLGYDWYMDMFLERNPYVYSENYGKPNRSTKG